ncbi:MAG: tRNA1(Val) (adenine(37)-N6)-methyltransferase [Treponema sp.]|nr:tRNA1(Val) (adenine(37)-N6)-methyltransferase [Spirochaetia bacterium]MDY2839131.1 tRNA1(Val) (adenine(37)-N6)-methyltransferase [Treponema sp.]MDY5123677.1 tRNA1(Val) (adenine(37)-N6)-methyltransferase [Treponema sp.]
MFLKENERLDILHNGNKIIQDPEKFCFGIDAVLLADMVDEKKNAKGLDLCTGNGIVPLLLEKKIPDAIISGIEIQSECAQMAQRSVELNGIQDKINIVEGDLKSASKIFEKNSFDFITCNPPYMINEHGKQNPNDYKAIARHEVLCNLDDILRESKLLLKTKASFYMIHRPFRLSEIFCTMVKYDIEPKVIQFVHPFEGTEPNLVLIKGVKNAASRLTVKKPLIVRNADGSYTEDIVKIYENQSL